MAAISFILHLIYIRFCPSGRKVWDEELDDATVECSMKLQHSPTTAATTATETTAATVAITEATDTPAVAARPATTALRTAATETAVATQATAAEFNPLLGEQRSGQRELDKYIC
nr:uncharacterized protein LOC128699010 [Cherax quadricarinatus]